MIHRDDYQFAEAASLTVNAAYGLSGKKPGQRVTPESDYQTGIN
jgi:hypothetical protein